MRRRYTEQGIGRSFTIYFNNKFKNDLSNELLTYSSISTISMLNVCSTKDLEETNEMFNAVYHYTKKREQRKSENVLNVDVLTLSHICISESPLIMKACFTILKSTALTQDVSLHPII
jgi:hypothetical protein